MRVESEIEAVSIWLAHFPQALDADECAASLFIRHGPPSALESSDSFVGRREILWVSEHLARVGVNGAAGRIEWTGVTDSVLDAELAVDPSEARGVLGPILCMIAGLVLAPRGALLVHASAVATRAGAVLLLGPSGAGKTTSARRLGREGATRIADDTVLVRRAGSDAVVEASSFDRASRLEGRLSRGWRLRGAYLVEKNARRPEVLETTSRPLDAWVRAAYTPPMPAPAAESLLSALAFLAARHPPRRLAVPPSGTILGTIVSPDD